MKSTSAGVAEFGAEDPRGIGKHGARTRHRDLIACLEQAGSDRVHGSVVAPDTFDGRVTCKLGLQSRDGFASGGRDAEAAAAQRREGMALIGVEILDRRLRVSP